MQFSEDCSDQKLDVAKKCLTALVDQLGKGWVTVTYCKIPKFL
jgi:hypothetical protein